MLDQSNCSRGETHFECVRQAPSASEGNGQTVGAWWEHGEGKEEVTGKTIRAGFWIGRPPTAYIDVVVASECNLSSVVHPMPKLVATREALPATP